MLDDVNQNDILFKHDPAGNTLNYRSPPETLPLFSDIQRKTTPPPLPPQKKKIRKYQKLKRERPTRALQELNNAKYIETGDTKTVNYDDDVKIDDLATVVYNSDTEMNLADKSTPPTSVAQKQVKRLIEKLQKPEEKGGEN